MMIETKTFYSLMSYGSPATSVPPSASYVRKGGVGEGFLVSCFGPPTGLGAFWVFGPSSLFSLG
ncbi:MAG: hypothetical protein NDF52_07800, partial [archaeon YNP-WB-062]|nr:hypothetical protein [Candidatus Culexarchaeum yellowstonense]